MSDTPIYIIQGNLNQGRRNINLLVKILENSYTLTLFNDCDHSNDIHLGSLIHYFSKLP